MARPDDGLAEIDRQEGRFPTPTTLPPPTTAPPPTTVGPSVLATAPVTTAPPVLAPPPTAPTTTVAAPTTTITITDTTAAAGSGVPPVPTDAAEPDEPTVSLPPDDPDYIAGLVPSLAGFTEYLSSPELAKAQVDQLLTTGRHDVAVPGPVASICAAVPMDRPLGVRGRWERDGRRIAATDLERRDSPGFGECLTDGGEALAVASYQYIAADSDGNESAAGGIVVGATRLDQRLLNDGAATICAIRIAPSVSRYFEVYVYAADPIDPGAEVTLPVASVEQDVEVVDCDDMVVASFSFEPEAGSVQSLAPS